MAWLAVMARNRAVDRLRQRRHVLSLDDGRHGLAASLLGEALGPEQMLAQFQSGTAVHRALLRLSAQRRYLLGLAFFQGLSHQEIADATRMPLGRKVSSAPRAGGIAGRVNGRRVMPKGSKPSRPAAEVLDSVVIQRMAAPIAPAELAPSDLDAMHGRIMQRIRDEAPPGTVTIKPY